MVGLEDDADWNDFETRTYLLSDALTEDERPVLRSTSMASRKKRSAGNPHAAFEEAGTGNVTMGTGSTGLYSRRASPRPYRTLGCRGTQPVPEGAPVGAGPSRLCGGGLLTALLSQIIARLHAHPMIGVTPPETFQRQRHSW